MVSLQCSHQENVFFKKMQEFPLWHSRLRIWCYLYGGTGSIPGLVQWVKDPVLLQLWRRLQLRLEFEPWPGNFHMPWLPSTARGKKTCKLCVRVSCYCQHEAVLDTVTQSPFPLHSVLFLVARNWSLGSVSPRPSCHQASGGDLDSANRTWNEIWKAEESTCSFSRSGGNWQWQPCILLAIRPCLWDRGELLLKKQFLQLPDPSFKAKDMEPPSLKGVPTPAFLVLPALPRTLKIVLNPAQALVHRVSSKWMIRSSQKE